MSDFARTGLTRRRFVGRSAGLGAVATLGRFAVTPTRASGAASIKFQTSSGARFGIPNAALIADYQKANPDVAIAMDTVPIQNYFPKLSTEVTSKSDAIDFFTGIPTLLYAFARTGKVVPFEDVLSPADMDDIVQDIPAHYLDTWRFQGKLYAIPNDSNAQWTFYRTDLFEEAGVKLPETWDDAAKVAKALTKGNVKGYTASLRRGEYAGAHFSSVLFSYGGEWWDKDFNPTLTSDAAKHAIEVMLELQDYADPGSINAGEDDTAQVIASGVAAWAPIEWGRSDLTDPTKTATAAKIETALPPAGGTHPASPCLGGQAYMIASWTDKKAEAAKFIKYATSAAVMRDFVKNEGQPARTSALTDPENIKIGRYFPTLQKAIAQGHPLPAVPESFQFLVELGNHVAEIMTKSVSPADGLKAANDSFARSLKDSGYL
jgi:sorbitol/mannitol transport system substrate-binding protein